MLQSGALSNLKKIIFVSSGGTVYGIPQSIPIDESHPTDPICAYGIHKLACEKYLQLFQFTHRVDTIILRVSNVYGPLQEIQRPFGAVEAFMRHAIMDEPITIWGDGSITRDYVHVDDVVASLLKAMSNGERSGIFNIGSGIGHTLNEIVRMIEKRLDKTVKVNYLPARNFDVPVNVLNIRKAKEQLGWEPRVSLEISVDQDMLSGKGQRKYGRGSHRPLSPGTIASPAPYRNLGGPGRHDLRELITRPPLEALSRISWPNVRNKFSTSRWVITEGLPVPKILELDGGWKPAHPIFCCWIKIVLSHPTWSPHCCRLRRILSMVGNELPQSGPCLLTKRPVRNPRHFSKDSFERERS